jgi:extracellular elastinolytic metalloproteinase
MRLKFLMGAAMVAALGVAMLPSSAFSTARIHEDVDHAVVDFDSRVGKIAPTKLQRAHAKRLKASVTWSQFGTPASIVRHGKFLARGIRGKTAPDAARWYLNRHKRLFGLGSVDALKFESSNRLGTSNGWAVGFRQVFGGLATSESGLVTVGVLKTKKGWKVISVSSSLTRDRALSGSVKLSAVSAWATAARNVGLRRSVANVLARKNARGWTQLGVAGLQGNQLVKLTAFPTVRNGVVPAFETVVLDAKRPLAARTFVDAATGKILARQNLVHSAASGFRLQAVQTFPFSGEVPAGDGSCDVHKGPFTVGPGVRALDGFSAATIPTNDLVLNLFREGVLILSADTLFSPEQFHYEPAGGVPPGNYTVQTCDFDDPPAGPGGPGWDAPRTYTGTFTIDDTPPPPPYLAKWKHFPNLPPLYTLNQDPWNLPNTDTRQVWCWVDAPGCDRLAGGALTSRGSWDHDHKLNTPTFTTRGNNAKSATSWTHDLLPSPPQFMPTSTVRDYSYPWTNAWANRDCRPIDPATEAPGSTIDDAAATVNLFVAHNRMHDWSYNLGFTERAFNAQDYNFGLTERRQENDPILGDVQAGALIPGVRDNANMITLPDGTASITNMYLWQPFAGSFYAPCVDGDYDMGVIGHEYGHMIENRMIGKGSNRIGHHAGAMGESHGDLFGMEIVNEFGPTPLSDENPFAVGVYDTGNKQRAIRNYGMNFPMSGGVPEPGQQLSINALNFSDMGYDITGPTMTSSQQVHANGEIFSATNFRIRQLLVEKYNDDFPYNNRELQVDCADGLLPADRCPGNRRWIQLLFDAMLLMPVNPSMLQARDFTLAADLARFGGANQEELWLGYARSGMGVGATSTNNSLAETDTDPVPDFESPLHNDATVRFRARDGSQNIAARFYVGHYEARVSPIADTNAATTGFINLDDTARFAPGTYEFVAHAPGFGHVRFRERLRSGQSKTITVEFARNWASQAAGATATGDVWSGEPAPAGTPASNVNFLIDDTERTNWTAAPPIGAGGAFSADGMKVTVDLAGSDDVTVRYVQVSTMLWNDTINPNIRSGQNRFTAVRQFELWACNADEGDNCSTDAGYSRVYTSPANAFPGDPPRPVAPHLILRKFDTPNFEATHVRFVAKTTQCTGTPAFQGDQDADPGVNSDCDTNASPGSATAVRSTRSFVRAAEFQVFDRNPDVD